MAENDTLGKNNLNEDRLSHEEEIQRDAVSCCFSKEYHTEFLDQGITLDFFNSQKYQEAFSFADSYIKDHGAAPAITTFKSRFPDIPVNEKIELHYVSYIIKELQKNKVDRELSKLFLKYSKSVQNGKFSTEQILSKVINELMQIQSIILSSKDIELSATAQKFLEMYRKKKAQKVEGGAIGISTGIADINEKSGGFKESDYYLIVGYLGEGKTWLMCFFAAHAYFKEGKNVLFISPEMTEEQIGLRVHTIKSHISNSGLQYGDSRKVIEKDYQKFIGELEQMPNDFVITCIGDANKPLSPETIRAKIEKYKPDIVFVDSVHRIVDDLKGEGHEKHVNVSTMIKRLGIQYRIPFVVSMQGSAERQKAGRAAETYDVMYSKAYPQDCDVQISLKKEEVLMLAACKKNRGGEIYDLHMRWSPDDGYFHREKEDTLPTRERVSAEILNEIEKDDDDEFLDEKDEFGSEFENISHEEPVFEPKITEPGKENVSLKQLFMTNPENANIVFGYVEEEKEFGEELNRGFSPEDFVHEPGDEF